VYSKIHFQAKPDLGRGHSNKNENNFTNNEEREKATSMRERKHEYFSGKRNE